ncbi:MAG: hypothetical protein ABIE74_00905 [Pseudomonadota bacterium]
MLNRTQQQRVLRKSASPKKLSLLGKIIKLLSRKKTRKKISSFKTIYKKLYWLTFNGAMNRVRLYKGSWKKFIEYSSACRLSIRHKVSTTYKNGRRFVKRRIIMRLGCLSFNDFITDPSYRKLQTEPYCKPLFNSKNVSFEKYCEANKISPFRFSGCDKRILKIFRKFEKRAKLGQILYHKTQNSVILRSCSHQFEVVVGGSKYFVTFNDRMNEITISNNRGSSQPSIKYISSSIPGASSASFSRLIRHPSMR